MLKAQMGHCCPLLCGQLGSCPMVSMRLWSSVGEDDQQNHRSLCTRSSPRWGTEDAGLGGVADPLRTSVDTSPMHILLCADCDSLQLTSPNAALHVASGSSGIGAVLEGPRVGQGGQTWSHIQGSAEWRISAVRQM